jgi:cell division septation protein DedD
MRNNETGEFELVVGNRQLLSGFFIVVLLFAVAFAMGYVVGQNSPRSVRTASDTPSTSVPAPNASDRSPLSPAAPPTPTTAAPTGPQAPPDSGPQPSTQPAQGSQPAGDSLPSSGPAVAAGGAELPAGSFWQVMAVQPADADAVRQTLKDKGFPVVLAPGPNNLTRVLVGPYADTSTFGRAKTDLENAGIHPVRFKRE